MNELLRANRHLSNQAGDDTPIPGIKSLHTALSELRDHSIKHESAEVTFKK